LNEPSEFEFELNLNQKFKPSSNYQVQTTKFKLVQKFERLPLAFSQLFAIPQSSGQQQHAKQDTHDDYNSSSRHTQHTQNYPLPSAASRQQLKEFPKSHKWCT
jgi:hypothetical protein